MATQTVNTSTRSNTDQERGEDDACCPRRIIMTDAGATRRAPTAAAEQAPLRQAKFKEKRRANLCDTPPTCIKDQSESYEYIRKELLGEVMVIF
jgi:hypothetical protein